jgi:transposase InsO family protein
VAANLLQQDFHADRPNQKWTTDTTYIWTQEGWLYLAVVLDVFSRMVARLVYGSQSGCDSGAPGLTNGNSSSLDSKRSYCITRIVVARIPVQAIWSWYRRMAWYRA